MVLAIPVCVLVLVLGGSSWASLVEPEGAYLDPPYPASGGTPSREVLSLERLLESTGIVAPRRSNTRALISKQTAVKGQGSRGTCSVFSATGLVEALYVIRRAADKKDVDFSEEWLEYLVNRLNGVPGSNSQDNLIAMGQMGFTDEKLLPYTPEPWISVRSSSLAQKRCGHLKGRGLQACLIVHRDPDLLERSDEELLDKKSPYYDPEFLEARRKAQDYREQHLRGFDPQRILVPFQEEVKELLYSGIPVTVDLPMYYGAWNHHTADALGIGRDYDQWVKGIVGFPEPDSKDLKLSPNKRAGHSVVIVGYDDDFEIQTQYQTLSGQTRRVKYKGVYFFKNSWGVGGFGQEFAFGGASFPGYGIMPQKYAHEHGAFYQFAF